MTKMPDVELSRLRVPPHSLEAEQSALGALLLDCTALERIAGAVAEADFYRFEHRLIFGAIAGLVQRCQPADVVTVFERLQRDGRADDAGGLPYLNDLAQCVPSAVNIRRYAEIVRERSMLRRLIAECDEAATAAFRGDSAPAIVEALAAKLAAVQSGSSVQRPPRSIAELALLRTQHYQDLEEGRIEPGWPTHIPTLDSMLSGGLRPGKLYILAARPKVGKSSLAQAIALTMAKAGRPTLFLSQEMGAEEVADRAVVSAGRISYGALLSGKMQADEWGRAAEALQQLSDAALFVDDQSGLTLADIRAKARAVPGLKVLVLDYLQLSASDLKDSNRNAQIEELSRGLKTLSKQMDLCVIALSQLNREVEKRATKRPQLSDLRDSGSIEQDADAVLFLWPVRDFEQEGRRLVGLAVEANRQGRCGAFGLDFHGSTQRWGESTMSIESAPVGARKQFD